MISQNNLPSSNKDKSFQKCISVCIIGKPNAGKSTLLNYIIGEKISIVTPKVQTTRSIITGVVTIDDVQLILFDTPGIFEPKKNLERAMVRCAWSSINSADLVVLIMDSSQKLDDLTQKILSRLREQGRKVIFLFNKIDLNSKYFIDNRIYVEEHFSTSIKFNISALTGKGVSNLIDFLKENALKSGWHYEKDDITNLPMRFLASEITREQLFLNLHQELPYNLTVESESWKEQPDGSVKVNQVIIVSRENYKSMILGKKGYMIKEIGINARKNIEQLLGCKIHLFLFVKVRKDWENNPDHYHNMGLKLVKL
jgi:GTP-binding protein Era